MDTRTYTCCFTGHRRFRPGDGTVVQLKLNEILEYLISCRGVRYFCAGGALGFDTMAAETVLRLKGRYPHIRLILVLPCPEQADRWPEEDIETYERHKRLADRVVYTADHYFCGCMLVRNRLLVDRSSWCVSYQYKAGGGTAYTVDYARKNHLALFNCIGDHIFMPVQTDAPQTCAADGSGR